MHFSKGFTLVELVISIAIFAAMTALVIARYGTFNQSTLVTNVAYDMALTIRTAQTYGISVKSSDATTNNFSSAYGVHFDMSQPTKFVMFVDNSAYVGRYYNGSQAINTYTLNSGAKITQICLGSTYSSPCPSTNKLVNTGATTNMEGLDITFKRPNPAAIFYCWRVNQSIGTTCSGTNINSNPINQPIAFITITSSDGTYSQVIYVRKNGQISVGS